MSISQLFQLYAPLAGLLVLAFWVGGLSQRVKTAEREIAELKDGSEASGLQRDRLTRLEALMENVGKDMKHVNRSLDGVQRQLGNLMVTGKVSPGPHVYRNDDS